MVWCGESMLCHAESMIMAEVIAALDGCKLAANLGHNKVCFELDALEVTKSVCCNIKWGR